MKKIVVALTALTVTQLCSATDSAGLVGIVNASGTVEVNNFLHPRDIWTVYFPNDPSESAVIIAYIVFRKLGQHQLLIEWTDQKGSFANECEYDPVTITKVPHIHTVTCKWGGRLPDGGLTFSVYDLFEGKKEKIGGIFLPSKRKQ